MAIRDHSVAIDISGNELSVTRLDRDGERIDASKVLTAEELESLWVSVDAVDWRSVKEDDVLGLDGTAYRIRFGGQDFRVWTPEDNTEERDLAELVKLKTLLWRIADISQ